MSEHSEHRKGYDEASLLNIQSRFERMNVYLYQANYVDEAYKGGDL
ncbi:hypothetical protein [Paenibacillus sp. YYML68]|nr:hypothetical protein [Paenibacillus sp. YYML68]